MNCSDELAMAISPYPTVVKVYIVKYTEIASPLIALGIIVTALFYVKGIYDKRRLNDLINS